MDTANINENPKGLYFVDDLPLPPHPNCQCEYGMVVKGKTQITTKIKRTLRKVQNILNRIKSSRKG